MARFDAGQLYAEMVRIRAFEDALARLWKDGLISGEMHLGIGEEAIIAGVVSQLSDGDALALDHRSTPAFVARGSDIEALTLEMLGSPDGLCAGAGGHMHVFDPDLLAASSGIVGSAGPMAAGFALAATQLRPGHVAVGFFGEGAMNQGMLLEAMNLAAAWRLPVLFVCKSNGWAITTRSRSVTGGDLVRRAAGLGCRTASVNGTNVKAVHKSAQRLLAAARKGRGPGFLIAHCTHPEGHFLGDPLLRLFRDPINYGKELAAPLSRAATSTTGAPARDRGEALSKIGKTGVTVGIDTYLRGRDPLRVARRLVDAEQADAIEAREREKIDAGVNAALTHAAGSDAVPALRPSEPTQPVSHPRPAIEPPGTAGPPMSGTKEMTFTDAIETALAESMASDDRVIVFGEDVEMLRRNLGVRFGPKRVRNTPISEAGFLGAAVGASMGGLRPVAEVMLVDFIGVCLDALLNHAAKTEAFSGGRWKVPLVVRTACGGGYGDGGQHEQCLWGMLAGIPGLDVVVPSNPRDAAGLMLSAIESDSPVVFCEHKLLADYWLDFLGAGRRDNVAFDVPEAGAHGPVTFPVEAVPLGVASVPRSGDDLTIFSVGVSVHRSLEAADLLAADDIETTVVDLRSISPLDEETIVAKALETGTVIVVDEDYMRFGLSGEVAAVLADAGVQVGFSRVTTESTLPYERSREDATLPNTGRIVEAARKLLAERTREAAPKSTATSA